MQQRIRFAGSSPAAAIHPRRLCTPVLVCVGVGLACHDDGAHDAPDVRLALGSMAAALSADGGVADGGVADGGAPDGGVADGGVADGGASDGGASDGGASDAGTAPSAPDADTNEGTGEGPTESTGETGIFVGMTAAHNAARAAVGAVPPLPGLAWSQELADFAQQWSNNLAATECGSIEHRAQSALGENIAIQGSTLPVVAFPPEAAVAGWVAEGACWSYGSIGGTESCDLACTASLQSTGCGHYTQVAWRNTQRVGCGYSTCNDGEFSWGIWVCNYDPGGNVNGLVPY